MLGPMTERGISHETDHFRPGGEPGRRTQPDYRPVLPPGLNIDSLAVGVTDDPTISRITIIVDSGNSVVEQVEKQLNKLIEVIKVRTLEENSLIRRLRPFHRKGGRMLCHQRPGATNLTTGIATAYIDSSPVVFITCNVTEPLMGKDAFQEVDITGIAMPITKATYLVRDAQTIPDVMRQAFAVAATGRPGPVLIDFLKNVTFLNTMIDYEFIPWTQNRSTGQHLAACSAGPATTSSRPSLTWGISTRWWR